MLPWLAENWLEVVQTAAVLSGLAVAVSTLKLDVGVRKTEFVLKMNEAHRNIWDKLIDRPELSRVLDPAADIVSSPATVQESRFVQSAILHIATVLQAVAEGAYDPGPGMDEDIREFLALPIPRSIAESILPFQSEGFQAYLRARME